jgi:hypothetical protein
MESNLQLPHAKMTHFNYSKDIVPYLTLPIYFIPNLTHFAMKKKKKE